MTMFRANLLLAAFLLLLISACSTTDKLGGPLGGDDDGLHDRLHLSASLSDSLAPLAPVFWVEPVAEGFRVRFNGQLSETTPDEVSGVIDFEGYRVYLGRENDEGHYGLIASYDRWDYDKWIWSADSSAYVLLDYPFTIDSLRCLYGGDPDPCLDSAFDPESYTYIVPYVHPDHPDSVFYFAPHSYNVSEFGVNTPFRKVYPDEPDPSTLDSLTPDRYTEEGYLKFYEYEVVIENLLSSVLYWVAVTAYDFGDAPMGVEPSESDKFETAVPAYPGPRPSEVPDPSRVFCYPNPYFEDHTSGFPRAVTFGGLAHRCTIRIYTAVGEPVRVLHHDRDPADPTAKRHEWDLRAYDGRPVPSGVYNWAVESGSADAQTGKLIIVR
jgi:hypothetical protein